MSKAAEGLTGDRKVDFVLFTRTAFIYSPSNVTTASFPMERGFDIRMVTLAGKNKLLFLFLIIEKILFTENDRDRKNLGTLGLVCFQC